MKKKTYEKINATQKKLFRLCISSQNIVFVRMQNAHFWHRRRTLFAFESLYCWQCDAAESHMRNCTIQDAHASKQASK